MIRQAVQSCVQARRARLFLVYRSAREESGSNRKRSDGSGIACPGRTPAPMQTCSEL
jgi:hypothetical protein